jgi:hypothetical protein
MRRNPEPLGLPRSRAPGANRIIRAEPFSLLEGFIRANQRLSTATEKRPSPVLNHIQTCTRNPPLTKATQKLEVRRAIVNYRHAEPGRRDNT